jgi:hypothetical protein
MFVLGALALLIAANLFAAAYVSSERFIYTWDYSLYWQKFGVLGDMLRHKPATAFPYIAWSIGNEDYTVLPLVPLIPFEFSVGDGRLSYILAITNFAVVPSAALLAWVAERTQSRRSWTRYLVCVFAVLCLHVLWAPSLRGLPDVLGVAIACAVLLLYFGKPREDQSLLRLIGLGLLLCLLILTRRWYLFWAVSFFPAAIVAQLFGLPRKRPGWRSFWPTARALAIVGVSCGACLLILAAPLLMRMATTDYASAYAAYRPDLTADGSIGQIVAQFGLVLLAVAVGGLAWLTQKPETRQLGILLIVQAILSVVLFARIQGYFGLHHFLLLAPAAGVGIAAAIISLWNVGSRWRWPAVAAMISAVAISSTTALAPALIAAAPLLPANRYQPLVRSDLAEIDRLLDSLNALKPGLAYTISSSELLNWSTLQMACRERHRALRNHLAVTADIDTRDGFPKEALKADIVLLATPTQYHVRPDDQRVVGLLARDIGEHRGIGTSFQRLPGEFRLMDDIRVVLYRKVRPLRPEDVKALSDELLQAYPQRKDLFAL